MGSAKKAGEQGNQGNADERNTAAGDELFYALGLCTGVVGAVTFEEIDAAPYAERTAESDDESLKSFDCSVEEFHIVPFLSSLLWIDWLAIRNPGDARIGGLRYLRAVVSPHLFGNFRRFFGRVDDFVGIKCVVGFCFQSCGEKLPDVEIVFRVGIGEVFIVGVLGNVILI